MMARHPDALTPRELACLRAYGELWSVKDVALLLGIHERTVSVHLSNARSKLGARKTGEAVQIHAQGRDI